MAVSSQKEIVITRLFDAPRELVFEAWTQKEHLQHWWGGNELTITFCEVELKAGGSFHICMEEQGRKKFWVKGNYREIDAPSRLVFDCALENEERNHNALWIVLFSEEGRNKTKVVITETLFDIADARDDAATGLNQCLDKLSQYLAGIQ
ncbi:MAG TPA: SRPBCC domain-containing protein [Chitinophagaceae bacterium]|nr:SRPBCC domain-containing protein [Chitinophagaceae bacterium]